MANDTLVASNKIPPTKEQIKLSEKKIDALVDRDLPQMVNWWDASVLSLVGVRTVISGTIGTYADQRPMQAMGDTVTDEELQIRHDYRDVKRDGVEKFRINGVERITPAVDEGDGRWSITTKDEFGTVQQRSLTFDKNEALWVDFIADLGDGFEATYAMAYLMAQDSIEVAVPGPDGKPERQSLPAGDIMIMGGDLAYPNATIAEYRARCIDPYNAAFQLKEGQTPPRKLFFIAGNHDWYDGLSAFTSVFCTARDRHSAGKGITIGGWQSDQRRSYFALALPHGWWFWGVDLALNASIDEAQKNYFETMSERTQPGEKIIIIVHAPIWQSMDDSPLHEVSKWARERGAEVVAMIAGDLHFYSRFHSVDPVKPTADEPKLAQQLQLIVSGGGGAFLHPTHQVPHQMKVHWTVPKPAKPLPLDHKGDFKDAVATIADDDGPIFEPAKPFNFRAPHIYPSRGRSMMLSLKNLLLPFHNRKFALFMGVFYLVYAWVFQITTQDPDRELERARADRIKIECNATSHTAKEQLACYKAGVEKFRADRSAARLDIIEAKLGLEPRHATAGTVANRTGPPPSASMAPKSVPQPSNAPNATTAPQSAPATSPTVTATPPATTAERLPLFGQTMVDIVAKSEILGGASSAADLKQDLIEFQKQGGWIGAGSRIWNDRIYPRIDTKHVLYAMLSNPAFFFMIICLYAGLIYYVGFEDGDFVKPAWLKWPVKIAVGGLHGWTHIVVLLGINGALQGIYWHFTDVDSGKFAMIFGVALYSGLLILIGGILGGMIFGLYWVSTSIIGRMHMDSFGALGIAGYKNFLRLRVEKDQITVYAIGLDKVPGRKGWRALNAKDSTSGHNPLIKPIDDLEPHLIEQPYVICATAQKPSAATVKLPRWKSLWS